MVEHFCAASLASGAEVTAGVTASAVLLARYPQSRRTYLTFRDERYSGSNLFILRGPAALRSEEHTSELQSLMRISYAVFCLKKKNRPNMTYTHPLSISK